jgi:acetyl-CoA C-acetyltransferase
VLPGGRRGGADARVSTIDPKTPCIIGVGAKTWHPADLGGADAPEPLAMWETVARTAAADCSARGGADVLAQLDSIDVVYCQSWPYDDAPGRLAAAVGASPRRRLYSGIGGTTTQVLVDKVAEEMLAGSLDLALVAGAESLATVKRIKQRGERPAWGFRDPEKKPFPYEAPFLGTEVAHSVFAAWLTFAMWDNARRAHLGIGLDEYRAQLGELFTRFTAVAAKNPHAWFPVERSASELVTPTATNRMVGYPYTKYLVAIMDVDMAAALLVATHEKADALGVPDEQRVYLRGWSYATDAVYPAEHNDAWRSPAMAAASTTTLAAAGVGVDDVAHFDLYSCFPSSVNFAIDALGLTRDDPRGLTVTGGLPYHGGPGSNYLSHSIAAMVDTLRADPGSVGLISGVGMHMTKHVYGAYSTAPPVGLVPPNDAAQQMKLDAAGKRVVVNEHEGEATVVSYSIVHGRDGDPEWGLLVCDVDAGVPDSARCYARLEVPDDLAVAEATELVGRAVSLTLKTVTGPAGDQEINAATLS